MNAPVIEVRFIFKDSDGNVGSIKAYVPISVSDSEMSAFIADFGSKAQALSNASLIEAKTYRRWTFDEPNVASPDTDLNSYAVLYYRTETYIEALSIPAPKEELFETAGIYQHIRVNPNAPAMDTWVNEAGILLEILSDQEGEPFPVIYLVGGKAL